MLTVGNTRPYPPTGLTTRLWAGVGIEWVDFADLTTTQDGVNLAGLLGHEAHSTDPYPHVVAWRGRLYLEDGHCRVGRAILRRQTRMAMRVFRMGDDGGWICDLCGCWNRDGDPCKFYDAAHEAYDKELA